MYNFNEKFIERILNSYYCILKQYIPIYKLCYKKY